MIILNWYKINKKKIYPNIICLGNFDGFHKGHLKIIKKTLFEAKKNNLKTFFFTFSKKINDFNNKKDNKIINSNIKKNIVSFFNFDYFLEVRIDINFLKLEWKYFLFLLKKKFNVKKIVVGEDFRFGNNRKGNIENLIYFFGKKNVFIINRKKDSFSSTKIRNLLISGNIEKANNFLYNFFSIKGIVEKGQQLGRKINFPTANIYLKNNILIPYGVYLTKTKFNFKYYNSITCFLQKNNKKIIETYLIINKYINLYFEEIEIIFLKFLRKNIFIYSLFHLKKIIKKDLEYAIAFFNENN